MNLSENSKKYQYPERGVLAAPLELASRASDVEESQKYRSMFMRDRDRILYSKAFRRLSGKTQIYISGSSDHCRTRLTHTLEVSQIARTISNALGLDSDLTEAIALGHDIGHTPFGHAGERMLHKILSPIFTDGSQNNEKEDNISIVLDKAQIEEYQKGQYFGFKHNLQSVRTSVDIENNYCGLGLNLTNYTLWGMYFHSGSKYKEGSVDPQFSEPDFYNKYNNYMSINNRVQNNAKLDNIGKNMAWSFEAYVVRVADEIAQRHHDLEDAVRSKAISQREICNLLSKHLKNLMKNKEEIDELKKMIIQNREGYFLPFMSHIVVNTLVDVLIDSSKENMEFLIDKYKIKKENATDFFYNHEHSQEDIDGTISYVKFSDDKKIKNNIKRHINDFKSVISQKILNSYDVQRSDTKGKYIIQKLFDAYFNNPQQLPDHVIEAYLLYVQEYKKMESIQRIIHQKGIGLVRAKFVEYHKKNFNKSVPMIKLRRVICDYIAGMTDTYAISEYKKLYE